MAKTGRPKIDNAKDYITTIRIDKEMLADLDAYCEHYDITRGEAIRKATKDMLKRHIKSTNKKEV